MKVSITTLGCPKNVVDSDHLARALISEGFVIVEDSVDAHILIVNTCGFIRDAKEESIEEILRLVEIKKVQGSRGGQRGNSSKRLIVVGCLAKRYKDELLREIPEVDGIYGVGEEEKVIEYCKGLRGTDDKNFSTSRPLNFQIPYSYAYLKIAEGCDKKCTFCVIPSIRGRFRSFSPDEILREAEEYIKRGTREIIVVAQDITSYKGGLNGYNLVSLLRDLSSINGDFYIRLLYLYPTEIDDELIDCVANSDKIFKYLDIPLQHSEDRLLRLMGRRGTKKEYIRLIRNIRRDIPGVVLRTTFIVGFPTETEEDFKGLIDFIEGIGFERLGVFKYSREEGTPASRLKDQIPERIKDSRYDEIMRLQSLISLAKNKGLVGRVFNAIIDEVDNDFAIARLYSHAPEIDGVVIIQNTELRTQGIDKKTMASVLCSQSSVKVGDVVSVKIVDAQEYDLIGIRVGDVL